MENNEALKKKYIKIYPTYIDKQLKHSEGRKVPLSIAVENPLTTEINAVCAQILGIDSAPEKHHHPKDWLKRGRVIVKLKQDGKPLLPNIKSKNDLIKYIAQTINTYRKQQTEEQASEEEKSRKKKRRKDNK